MAADRLAAGRYSEAGVEYGRVETVAKVSSCAAASTKTSFWPSSPPAPPGPQSLVDQKGDGRTGYDSLPAARHSLLLLLMIVCLSCFATVE